MRDRIRNWLKKRPRPVPNVIQRTKRKLIYGAVGLGVLVGLTAVVILKLFGG